MELAGIALHKTLTRAAKLDKSKEAWNGSCINCGFIFAILIRDYTVLVLSSITGHYNALRHLSLTLNLATFTFRSLKRRKPTPSVRTST
jgi:hypothetical protein